MPEVLNRTESNETSDIPEESSVVVGPRAQTMAVIVCPITDLPLGLGRAFQIGRRTLALFLTRSGGVYAVDNRCPHKGGPLADGMIADGAVVCPLHAFRFSLVSGACDQEGQCPVTAYPAHVENGMVIVDLPVE